MRDHSHADDARGGAHDARAEVGWDSHRELWTGKQFQHWVSDVDQRRHERPDGVVREERGEHCEGERTEGSIAHSRWIGARWVVPRLEV